MDNELEALNTLCRNLYDSVDQQTRLVAEQHLSELVNSENCLQRCQLLLEQGIMPYAPLVAAKTLMKLLTIKTGIMPADRLELCRYILTYLGAKYSEVPSFVITELCQLFARITKLEWAFFDPLTDEYPFRTPIASIVKTISLDNAAESLLAVELLSLLVVDMNTAIGIESVSAHRRSSAIFRDDYLYDIFKMTVDLLEKFQGVSWDDAQEQQKKMVVALLDLCLNSLLFDFIGSLSDETSEDNYNMQVPTCWRNSFIDGGIVKLMIRLYQELPQEAIQKVIHILVQLASIRRTIFNGNERQAYLKELIVGIKDIIENPGKLNDQNSFHEFCRLVARLKTNFQLCEMIKFEEYEKMLGLLAHFTVQSLTMMEFVENSTYFLLNFWFRMVTSVPFVRVQDEHHLNVYCPEIYSSYVKTRLDNVSKVIRDGKEDPLEDQGSILQVMEQLAVICRCEYKKTVELLIEQFENEARVVLQGPTGSVNVRIAEGRLTWLITLMGTAIYGKTATQGSEEFDKLDGEMVVRALKFMEWSDKRLVVPQNSNQLPVNGNLRLEVAFVHLLDQFRRAYIMDQVSRATFVYSPLTDELGIEDEMDMLNVIVRKIITNLKMWATQDQILDLSLSLLKELSLGYTALRKLFRLPDIQLLLENHTAEHFAFLGTAIEYRIMKERTTFYEALTRLLFSDVNDDEAVFLRYMMPLTETAQGLYEVMKNSNANVDVEQIKKALVGLCRDVRGVSISCTTKPQFQMLIDWMSVNLFDKNSIFVDRMPNVFNVMQHAIELWADSPEITSPIFHLFSELCQNRQQRLRFEMNSCITVLLFREVSRLICTWGARVANIPPPPHDRVYKERYKNIGIIFLVLKHSLAGGYVPYGVFRLYGDPCLVDCLNMFIKLFRMVPEEDFLTYTKISQNYFYLLEVMVQDNLSYVTNLEPDVFTAILRSISSGILSMDAVCITSACSALDLILCYMFKRFTREAPINRVSSEPEGDNCLRAVESNPLLLQDLLKNILQMVIFGEVKCQWSISRPLLGLILLQEQIFTQIKSDIVVHFPSTSQPSLEKAFMNLMEGIEPDISSKSKDAFTQNLAKFRKEVLEVSRGKEIVSSSSASQSGSTMAF